MQWAAAFPRVRFMVQALGLWSQDAGSAIALWRREVWTIKHEFLRERSRTLRQQEEDEDITVAARKEFFESNASGTGSCEAQAIIMVIDNRPMQVTEAALGQGFQPGSQDGKSGCTVDFA